MMMNSFLFNLNELMGEAFNIVGFISGVLSVLSAFGIVVRIRQKKKRKYFFFLLFISVGLLSMVIYSNKLVKVPDVINLSYSDACSKLSSVDLRYNHQNNPDSLYIIDQSPEEGTIVYKKTEVVLSTESISENPNHIQAVREEAQKNGIPLAEINVNYKEIILKWELGGNLEDIHTFGTDISNAQVIDLYLEDMQNGITYTNYAENEDGTFSFFDIPTGGKTYTLHSEIKGYDIKDTTFKAESFLAEESKITVNDFLSPCEEEDMRPYIVHLANSDGNALSNYEYSASIDPTNLGYTGYSDEAGCAGVFYGHPGQIVYIFLENNTTVCKVELTGIEEGEFLNYPVIILDGNGGYRVTNEQEFFNH